MPNGYSVPNGGATDTLMKAIGRHGHRPAHVHFFIEAPGYRKLTTQINFGDDPHGGGIILQTPARELYRQHRLLLR